MDLQTRLVEAQVQHMAVFETSRIISIRSIGSSKVSGARESGERPGPAIANLRRGSARRRARTLHHRPRRTHPPDPSNGRLVFTIESRMPLRAVTLYTRVSSHRTTASGPATRWAASHVGRSWPGGGGKTTSHIGLRWQGGEGKTTSSRTPGPTPDVDLEADFWPKRNAVRRNGWLRAVDRCSRRRSPSSRHVEPWVTQWPVKSSCCTAYCRWLLEDGGQETRVDTCRQFGLSRSVSALESIVDERMRHPSAGWGHRSRLFEELYQPKCVRQTAAYLSSPPADDNRDGDGISKGPWLGMIYRTTYWLEGQRPWSHRRRSRGSWPMIRAGRKLLLLPSWRRTTSRIANRDSQQPEGRKDARGLSHETGVIRPLLGKLQHSEEQTSATSTLYYSS